MNGIAQVSERQDERSAILASSCVDTFTATTSAVIATCYCLLYATVCYMQYTVCYMLLFDRMELPVFPEK